MKKSLIVISCLSALVMTGCAAGDKLIVKIAGIENDADYKKYQDNMTDNKVDSNGNYISEDYDKDFIVPTGDIHVSFFDNKNIMLKYYYDAQHTREIDVLNCYMDPGEKIYASIEEINNSNSDLYDFSEFKIFRYDENGDRYNVDCSLQDKEIIAIPDDLKSKEIAIEPIGYYPKKQLSFEDTIVNSDGTTVKANGSWYIDNKKCDSDSVDISSTATYAVTYEYDQSKYYFVKSSPEAYFYSDDKGKVIFSDSKNDSGEYSVELHKNISADTNIKKTGLIELRLNNELINDNNRDKLNKLKCGDVLKFTTDNNNNVVCKDLDSERDVTPNDGYVFTYKIPNDADGKYQFTVRNWLEKEKVRFEVKESSLWKKALSITPLGKEDEDKLLKVDNGEKTFTYLDLKNGKDIPLKEINDLTIYVTQNIEKFQNLVFKVSVNGKAPQYLINKDDSIKLKYSETDTVKIDVCKGFVFNEKEIKNNYEGLTLHYYVDGNEVYDGQFIEEGKTVNIKAECAEGVVITGGAIEAGKLEGNVVIKSNTKIKNLVVNADSDGSFVFNSSDYKYEHGTIIFKYKGDTITDGQRIGLGSEITYEAVSTDNGYWLPDGEHTIVINGEDQAKAEMRSIKFYKHEKRNVRLIYPDYGGNITYSLNGKPLTGTNTSVYCGSEIEMSFIAWNGWSTDYFDNTKYVVTEDENQVINVNGNVIDNNIFKETSGHKPTLTVDLDKSVGKTTKFSVTASGSVQELNKKHDNNFSDKTIFEHKIGTEKGFTITAEEGALSGGKRLKIKVEYVYDNEPKANLTWYIDKLPGSVTINVYNNIQERQSQKCKEINVIIEKV